MLKNTPKHVKVLYQPKLELTQNQPRCLRLKFWALESRMVPNVITLSGMAPINT
jgi:hypothetical protein